MILRSLTATLFGLLLLITFSGPAFAADSDDGNPDALGHSADGNYWDWRPIGKLELPRLFVTRSADGALGFDAFLTTKSALNSGDYTVRDNTGERVAEARFAEIMDAGDHLYYPVAPRDGEIVLDLSITRQLLFVFIVALLVYLIISNLASRYAKGIGRDVAPKGVWHNMMETVIVFVRDEIARPAIGEAKYAKYLPYLLTVFIFIMLGNLLGLVPWIGVTATSHIMVTGTLAVFTFFITQFAGTKDYWAHILNPPGVPGFVKPILIPIEIIGLFTKPLSLAFRLFGNMASGHLVIVSLIGIAFILKAAFGVLVGSISLVLVSIPLTVFIYILKLAVSLIQAYIFTMLSAVFIGIAAEEHHHHDHDDHRDELHAPTEQLAAAA